MDIFKNKCLSYDCPNHPLYSYLIEVVKVSQKSAMWHHKNEGLSISFLGVFSPSSPLIPLIFMTSHCWFWDTLSTFQICIKNWGSEAVDINELFSEARSLRGTALKRPQLLFQNWLSSSHFLFYSLSNKRLLLFL